MGLQRLLKRLPMLQTPFVVIKYLKNITQGRVILSQSLGVQSIRHNREDTLAEASGRSPCVCVWESGVMTQLLSFLVQSMILVQARVLRTVMADLPYSAWSRNSVIDMPRCSSPWFYLLSEYPAPLKLSVGLMIKKLLLVHSVLRRLDHSGK